MTNSRPEGFLALPSTGEGLGVLVMYAWWGLNDTLKAFCTRLAESGSVVFAPDLYHGKVAEDIAAAEALIKDLNNSNRTEAEIAEAAMFLNDRVGQDQHGLAWDRTLAFLNRSFALA
jgi:carboxymethylenebutenolidase